jgi:hypothetical protein
MQLERRGETTSPSSFTRVVAVAAGIITSIFIAFTVLYNLPESKVREELAFVDQVMEPVFSQRWTLFAPEAPMSDTGILAKYDSSENSIGYRNLTTPALEAGRNTFTPAKSTRELGSLVHSYGALEEELLKAADNDDTVPLLFLATNDDVEKAVRIVAGRDERLVGEYEEAREKLAVAALHELGGSELKRQCQVSGGQVTVKLVGVAIPGWRSDTEEPAVRTLKPMKCGEDFDAAE